MKKIIDLRKEYNLSQSGLAERIGVTQATVSRWESNQTSINGYNLLKLSKYFNVSTDDLLGNELIDDTTTSRDLGSD